MSNPIIANNRPAKISLEKGREYYFCRCGRSKQQPFCDGSHRDTSFTPPSTSLRRRRETLTYANVSTPARLPFAMALTSNSAPSK